MIKISATTPLPVEHGWPGFLPAQPPQGLAEEIAWHLARLYSNAGPENNPLLGGAVPKRSNRGGYLPVYTQCPSGNWKAHFKEARRAAEEHARSRGASESEVRQAGSAAYRQVKDEHTACDDLSHWVNHVRGVGSYWNDNGYRGAYESYAPSKNAPKFSRWSILDVDAIEGSVDPAVRAGQLYREVRAVVGKDSCMLTTSQSGKGFHVAVYWAQPVPRWQARLFAETIVARVGLNVGSVSKKDAATKDNVEVFPKSKNNGGLGSLVGMPCSMAKLGNGGSLPIVKGVASRDPQVWLRELRSKRGAGYDVLVKTLTDAGHDLTQTPQEKLDSRREIKLLDRFGRRHTIRPRRSSGNLNPLDEEILKHLTAHDVMHEFGHAPIRGDRYACPLHGGVKPNFELWRSGRGYTCHSTCSRLNLDRKSGTAIRLYAELSGKPYTEARAILAARFGIDVESFKRKEESRAGGTLPPLERVKAPKALAAWCNLGLRAVQNLKPQKLGTAVLATARVLIEHGFRIEETSAALWAGLEPLEGHSWSRSLVTENVAGLVADLQEGRKDRAGAAFLRRILGRRMVHHLLRSAQKTLRLISDHKHYAKLIGIGHLKKGSTKHRVTREVSQEIGPKPKPVKVHGVKIGTPPDFHPDRKIRGAVSRPGACGDFANRIKGADTGTHYGDVKIRCDNQVVCDHCAMTRALNEWAIVRDDPAAREALGLQPGDVNPHSWVGKGEIYAFEVTLDDWSCEYDGYEQATAAISRCYKFPKLRAIGFDLQGKLRLLYVGTDDRILSMCAVGKTRVETFRNPLDAIQRVIDHRLTVGYHYDELCLAAELPGQREWAKAEIKRYLHFVTGKHLIRASTKEGALPWPPRSLSKGLYLAGAEEPLPERGDEPVTYSLVHVKTDYVLASGSEQPYSIDQAITLARQDVSFQHVLETLTLARAGP